MKDLSMTAGLVSLEIRLPQMRKMNKNLSNQVEIDNNAITGIVNVSSSLIEDKIFDELKTKAGLIRSLFYKETLPWSGNGLQIISMKNFISFSEKFRCMKMDFEKSKELFISSYEDIKIASKKKLGNLYNEGSYPSKDSLINRIGVSIKLYPLPVGEDFRLDLPKEELEKIKKEIEINTTAEIFSAQAQIWVRLKTELQNVLLRLGEGKVLKQGAIKNLLEIVEKVPKLNILDCSILNDFALSCQTIFEVPAKDLRENEVEREKCSTKILNIINQMEDYM